MSRPHDDDGGGGTPSVVDEPDELAGRVAELDWAQTPLGARESWPASLTTAVRILLTSRFSMWMAWGPQLTMFYNDAYWRDTLRAKHPWALGRSAREVWAEIWDDIGPRIESVLATGQATWDEDLPLFLERSGYPEETYHTFSYSPLADDVHVVGMLCVVTENTDRVLSERRMATLRDMATALAAARTEVEVLTAVEDQLATNPYDLPFSLVYLYDDDGGARLVCASGIDAGAPAAPVAIAPTDADHGWPAQRLRAGHTELVEDLAERFAELPVGAWTRSPTAAVVTALAGAPGENRVRGFLVVGLNPFRPFDERYRGFIELTAAQISSALVNAGTYEAERRRAEALAELDRAKTEFFSNVSHEFRTPLTLIMGPIEALRAAEQVDADRVRTELEVAHRNGLRLGRLVNTLLDFSRLQAGRMQARFVPTDLGAFTAELAGMFRSATERAGLRLDVEVDELDEPVWVDRDSWEKIVSNLLSNAVKFTLDGTVGVRLRPAGGAVALEVADTGIGIPADETGRLFERFHQVRGARGRSAEGSGIGLALVRDLVGLHGGTVTAASRPGEGTTFIVEIPLGHEHLPQDQVVADPTDSDESVVGGSSVAESFVAEALRWMDTSGEPVDPGPVATDATQATQRLLIADDNADMREYMVRLLGGSYELQVVGDGTAALAAARSDPPDLVITDVMMPGLDGFALLAALRADRATAAVPVIVLSARAGQDAVVEGLTAGADDYLVKPFAATELLARVRSVLALARVRRREAAWRGALLGALQDGLFVVDGAGQVVQINEGFADIFGYGRDGLPYAVPHPWWPDADREPDEYQQVVAAMAEVQASGQARKLLALRHRDGHRLWIECSADTIADPDRPDGPPMLIGLARDVTAVHRVGRRDRLLAQTAEILASTEPTAVEGAAAETESAGGRLVGRIQRVVDLAAPVFDDLVVVVRTGPDGRMPPVAAAHPRRPEQAQEMLALDPYHLPTSLVETYRQGRAFVLDPAPALLREALRSDADSLARAGLGRHATLVAPLAVHGRLLGLLIVLCPGDHPGSHSEASGRFDQLDVELADELARRIAAALQTQWVAAREHQLNAAATALAAAGTVPAAAAALVSAVRRAFDPSGVGIYVPRSDNPARLQLIHSEGLPHDVFEHHATVDVQDRTATAEAARTGRSVWESGPTRLFDGATAAEAWAALPLRQAGRTVGVLGMTFATAREFPDDERSFATTLVTQAAQAFERAALTDARAQVADTLQHSLLPATPPTVDQLALATHYLPGVAGVQAGGDWYDVIPLDPDRTAIVVGDVVGQGAQAAAVMGQLRAALSAILTMLGPGSDPAEALARLNDYAPRVPGARGSTAVCVIIDTDAGTLRWARAGHPPPLLLRHDGELVVLDDAGGPLLGAYVPGSGSSAYTSVTTGFVPGDTVLLYTDGLVERRGELIDDGIDRLAAAARKLMVIDPSRQVTDLIAAVVPDQYVHDDIALVAARCLPPALRARHPALPAELTHIRRRVAGWAAAAGLHPEQADDLQLALGEALANAVEHAYRDREPGEVEYSLERAADGSVQAAVTDFGAWQPPPADRGFRGRGLEMIRALGDAVAVEHAVTGTVVRFTVPPPPLTTAGPSADRATVAVPPAARPADLHVHREPGLLRLALHGEIDLAGIDDLRERMLAEIDDVDTDTDADTRLVLDLRQTSYLPSAGAGLILELAEHLRRSGRSLRLRPAPDGPVARVLALTGLDALSTPPSSTAMAD